MRFIVILATCTAVLTAPWSDSHAVAFGSGYVGIYSDSVGTESHINALPGVTTAYIIATPTQSIIGAEFRIEVSPSPAGYLLLYQPPPNATGYDPFDMNPGDPSNPSGTIITFNACQPTGTRVNCGTILVFNFNNGGPLDLTIRGRTPSSDPSIPYALFQTCGEQDTMRVSMAVAPYSTGDQVNFATINNPSGPAGVPAGWGVVAGETRDSNGVGLSVYMNGSRQGPGTPSEYYWLSYAGGVYGTMIPPGSWTISAWWDGLVDRRDVLVTAFQSTEQDFTLVPQAAIRVTAQVRAEHDDGPFIDPPPPLRGVTVRLDLPTGEPRSITAMTDDDGVARFGTPPTQGATYHLSLGGQLFGSPYDVSVQYRYNGRVVPQQHGIPMVANQFTYYTWPYDPTQLHQGPALQVAYHINRFRRVFWQSRLGFSWDLPLGPGFNRSSPAVVVTIKDEDAGLQAYGGAVSNAIYLDLLQHRGEEADIIYHEMTHLLIADRLVEIDSSGTPRLGRGDGDTRGDEGAAMDEGLADYFAASFTNDPVIARCNAWYIYPYDSDRCFPGAQPLRNLEVRKMYPWPLPYRHDEYAGAPIFAGALWELRRRIDGPNASEAWETDRLVKHALDYMITENSDPHPTYRFTDFYDALIAVDGQLSQKAHGPAITEAFELHNMINPVPHTILETLISSVVPQPAEIIIGWPFNRRARGYQVLRSTVDYNGFAGLGGFVSVSPELTDTTFTYLNRDPRVEYLFSVVAIDSSGQDGYLSPPVFVAALDTTVTGVSENRLTSSRRGRFLFSSPNPFNPETQITFEVTSHDVVGIRIYNAGGQLVTTLPTQRYSPGRHSVKWSGRDHRAQKVASGAYYLAIAGAGWQDRGKIILLK